MSEVSYLALAKIFPGDKMSLTLKGFAGKGSFAHGIHPPERKSLVAEKAVEIVLPPTKVILPLLQNVGAPCEPVVQPKQNVSFEDLVCKGAAPVSACLHSPVTGRVWKISVTTLPNGRHVKAIFIRAEGEQLTGRALWEEIYGGDWPTQGLEKFDPQKIITAIYNAGIVGQGGAAFPTHVKLTPDKKRPLDTVLINGCECEPYLNADYRLMIEAPGPVVSGALLIGRVTGAKEIIIGIEDNKPEAVESLKRATSGTGIKIAVVRTKYPQGSEKQLIMAVLKREVPMGGLPLDVGVVVNNVATAAAVARAVIRGKPLTHRIVSVTGAGIVLPKNLLVPIGIGYGELIKFCGGLTEEAARLIAGGPMTGFAFINLETPVTKGTGGLTVLTREDVRKAEETSCIRCGRCVDVCPMNLVPTRLALASRHNNLDLLEKYNVQACFECGCCAYICPAGIPLVQLIRAGKALSLANKGK
jgi:electron transport complex protein RnfC